MGDSVYPFGQCWCPPRRQNSSYGPVCAQPKVKFLSEFLTDLSSCSEAEKLILTPTYLTEWHYMPWLQRKYRLTVFLWEVINIHLRGYFLILLIVYILWYLSWFYHSVLWFYHDLVSILLNINSLRLRKFSLLLWFVMAYG